MLGHGLFMRTTSGRYDWSAGAADTERGYVCVTRCKKGFEWYPEVEKCLKVEREEM